MKKLLLITALLVSLGVFSQAEKTTQVIARHSDGTPAISLIETPTKQDTGKKEVQLPAPAQVPDKLYYLILPRSNWDKILTMLRRSKNPSDEIDDAITYILQNAKEFVPPPPASDSVKPKK